MKLALITICVLGVLGAACKLETSSATPNSNVNANANANQAANLNSSSQSSGNCQLSMAGAPHIKELKLGMTPDEVLALFPDSKEDEEVRKHLSQEPSQFGVSDFIIRPEKFGSKDKFKDVTQITFNLLDGRVSVLTVGFNGPEYAHVDELVKKFIQGTNLPPVDQWQGYEGMDSQLKILACKDFEVRAFIGGEGGKLNYVLMKDLDAEKKLKERKAKAKAQASPTP
jgi:hypothetical protein